MKNQNKKIVKTKFTRLGWMFISFAIISIGLALLQFLAQEKGINTNLFVFLMSLIAIYYIVRSLFNREVVSTSIGTRAEIKKTEVDTDSRYQKTQDDKDLFCSNYNIAHRIFHNISHVVFENKGCISYFRTEEGEYSCTHPEVTPSAEISSNH